MFFPLAVCPEIFLSRPQGCSVQLFRANPRSELCCPGRYRQADHGRAGREPLRSCSQTTSYGQAFPTCLKQEIHATGRCRSRSIACQLRRFFLWCPAAPTEADRAMDRALWSRCQEQSACWSLSALRVLSSAVSRSCNRPTASLSAAMSSGFTLREMDLFPLLKESKTAGSPSS